MRNSVILLLIIFVRWETLSDLELIWGFWIYSLLMTKVNQADLIKSRNQKEEFWTVQFFHTMKVFIKTQTFDLITEENQSLSHTQALSHSLSLTRTHSFFFHFTHTRSLSSSHPLSPLLFLSRSLAITLHLSPSFSLSQSLSLSLSPSFSLSVTLTTIIFFLPFLQISGIMTFLIFAFNLKQIKNCPNPSFFRFWSGLKK